MKKSTKLPKNGAAISSKANRQRLRDLLRQMLSDSGMLAESTALRPVAIRRVIE